MASSRRIITQVIIYIVAACSLIWVLHDVRFDELLRNLRAVNIGWLLLALATDVLSTVVHGVRWHLLLKPQGGLSILRTTQAIYAGLFTNQVVPLRTGELVRGYLASRWMDISFAAIVPSMVTERIFEGILLVSGLGICAVFVTLPQSVANAGVIVGIVTLTLVAVLVIVAFVWKPKAAVTASDDRKRPSITRRITSFLARFALALRTVWNSPYVLAAFVLSLVFLSLQALSFWMVMVGCGLDVSPWVPAVVLIAIRLGTAAPNLPANVGPYQFFCVAVLVLFGVEKTTAAGVAIVLSVVFMVPLLILGFLAFAKSGLTMSEVRRSHYQH